MRIEFDDGTLLLHNAPTDVPFAAWDDRVDQYRAQAYQYRQLLEWTGMWTAGNGQVTLPDSSTRSVEDAARAYPDLALTPALHIEPREYQRAALAAWREHDRRGSVILPQAAERPSSVSNLLLTRASAHS